MGKDDGYAEWLRSNPAPDLQELVRCHGACAGVRLATGKPGWVPLIEGYEAADEPPGHITVFCPITDGNGDEMNTAPTSGPAIEAT